MQTISTKQKQVSYSGHTKTSVFSQWQKHLQQQEYEICCHWMAEIDCSNWQNILWDKITIYASKHIHLHCPLLPALLCHHIYAFDIYVGKDPIHTVTQFRINLCQIMGILCLSAKSPIATLPKVDSTKVDNSELIDTIHPYVIKCIHTGDDNPIVIRLLTTMFHHLDDTHYNSYNKVLYWLSVIIECDKYAIKQNMPFKMKLRSPNSKYNKTIYKSDVDKKYLNDWVWLMWDILCEMALHRVSVDGLQTLLSLRYLFAREYTTSKRTARIPLLIHAFLLLRAGKEIRNTGTIYSTDSIKKIVTLACNNINIMYDELQQANVHKNTNHFVNQIIKEDSQNNNKKKEDANIVTKVLHTKTEPNNKTNRNNKTKNKISESSRDKWDTLAEIDELFLGGKI